MSRGPKQQLLADYVAPANDATLDELGRRWSQGASLLRQYALELQQRSDQISGDPEFTGDTAATAKTSFAHSATTMTDKSNELMKGSGAFHSAAGAVRQAHTESQELAKHDGDAPPSRPDVTPGSNDPEDVRKMHDYNTATASYWDGYHAREAQATSAIADLQTNHEQQAKVFQEIHGETPPAGTSGGGTSNPVTAGTPAAITHAPVTNVPHGPSATTIGGPTHNPPTQPPVVHAPPPPVDVPAPPTHHNPVPTGPGVPQGPGATQGPGIPAGPGLPGGVGSVGSVGSAGTTGSGLGAVGGVGAVAGGALGRAAAAGLAAGGLNGGLNGLVPLGGSGVRGSLSASGVRGIGATSRTGVGSVLGRGTGTTGRAGTGGMAGGMAGRSSGRGAGRGAGGSAGTRGSRGRAGSRGAGAGGTGRNGKDKKGRGEDRDLFDDGSDWIDDEDVAPGLLD